MADVLRPDQARYVVYKQDDPQAKYVFISFVPDSAPVRSKMLYASSTNTIHRELGGTARFGASLFWTDLSEVSEAGWDAHKAHISAPAPETPDEKGARDALHEHDETMRGSRKLLAHNIHTGSTGLSMAIDDHVTSALQTLVQGDGSSAVALRIDLDNETVVVDNAKNVNDEQLGGFINGSRPQYTVFRHPKGKVAFIYTCPSGSKIKERMVYASNRESVIATVREVVQLEKVLEATDGSDLSPSMLLEELYPEPSEGSSRSSTPGFARPKRPGRR